MPAVQTAPRRPQELHEEFPRDARVLTLLKLADVQVCNLAERYHALGRAIGRLECEAESASDLYLARLKKQRLALLDEIAVVIEEAEARLGAGPAPVLDAVPA